MRTRPTREQLKVVEVMTLRQTWASMPNTMSAENRCNDTKVFSLNLCPKSKII